MKERNPKLNLPEEVPEDSILEELPPRILKHAGKKSKTSKIYSITLVWLLLLWLSS